MKTQVHNKGELKLLSVEIEKDVIDGIETMSKNSGISLADIVVIALKRYRASHSDLEGKVFRSE